MKHRSAFYRRRIRDARRGAGEEPIRAYGGGAIRLIALTGLRADEACGLRWREVDAATQCLRLEATKTGRSMRPIGTALQSSICKRSPAFMTNSFFPTATGPAAPTSRSRSRSYSTRAGLYDARAQTLRRTFASYGRR